MSLWNLRNYSISFLLLLRTIKVTSRKKDHQFSKRFIDRVMKRVRSSIAKISTILIEECQNESLNIIDLTQNVQSAFFLSLNVRLTQINMQFLFCLLIFRRHMAYAKLAIPYLQVAFFLHWQTDSLSATKINSTSELVDSMHLFMRWT